MTSGLGFVRQIFHTQLIFQQGSNMTVWVQLGHWPELFSGSSEAVRVTLTTYAMRPFSIYPFALAVHHLPRHSGTRLSGSHIGGSELRASNQPITKCLMRTSYHGLLDSLASKPAQSCNPNLSFSGTVRGRVLHPCPWHRQGSVCWVELRRLLPTTIAEDRLSTDVSFLFLTFPSLSFHPSLPLMLPPSHLLSLDSSSAILLCPSPTRPGTCSTTAPFLVHIYPLSWNVHISSHVSFGLPTQINGKKESRRFHHPTLACQCS